MLRTVSSVTVALGLAGVTVAVTGAALAAPGSTPAKAASSLVAAPPAAVAGPPVTAAGKKQCSVTDSRLRELSGLVATKNGYIVVNDSTEQDDRKRVFYLNKDCQVVRDVPYSGAGPFDTEDLAVAPDGKTLWIADTGDNVTSRERRERVAVWSMPIGGGSQPKLHRLSYPDGKPRDAEALLIGDDKLPLIITKVTAGKAEIFTPDGPLKTGDTEPVPMKKLGDIELPRTDTENPLSTFGRVAITGAARSLDGSRVVLRTYADAFEYDVANGDIVTALTTTTPRVTALADPFGEAISYSTDGKTFLTVSDAGHLEDEDPVNILSYTPSTEGPKDLANDPDAAQKSGQSFLDGLTPTDIMYLIAAVGVLGALLVGAGIFGILRARKRPAPAGRNRGDDDVDAAKRKGDGFGSAQDRGLPVGERSRPDVAARPSPTTGGGGPGVTGRTTANRMVRCAAATTATGATGTDVTAGYRAWVGTRSPVADSDAAQHRDHPAHDGGVVAGDRVEGRILRHQPDVTVTQPVGLHGRLAVEHGGDDLTRIRGRLLPDHHPVAVADRRVEHRVTLDLEHEDLALADQLARQREDVLHRLLGEDRATGGDATEHRDVGRRGALGAAQLVVDVVRRADVDGPGPVRIAPEEALLLQFLELVGDARRGNQPDRLADLAHARRVAVALDPGADEVEDASLPGGEVDGRRVGEAADHRGHRTHGRLTGAGAGDTPASGGRRTRLDALLRALWPVGPVLGHVRPPWSALGASAARGARGGLLAGGSTMVTSGCS